MYVTDSAGIETPEEFFMYNFGYDVVTDSKQAMLRENPEWELPDTFFETKPAKGLYPCE
jgi:salicylate hydroxylase